MANFAHRHQLWFVAMGAMLILAAGMAITRLLEVRTPAGLPDMSGWPVTGIDISAHNGNVDFVSLCQADSVSFVLLKATEGQSFKDRYFNTNYWQARKAGLKVGAYHFFRFESSGEMQAINLLNSLRGKTFDLPAVIDVEEWTNPGNELTDSIIRRVRDMADYLKARGVPVMVYSNLDGYTKFLKSGFDDCHLWICALRSAPPDNKWEFWQFTHRGRLSGVKGRVDQNIFNGDSARWADLTAKWRWNLR